MQKQESQVRELEHHTLTIYLNGSKLIIRALEKTTSDLFIAQFKRGALPNDVKGFYQCEEIFFDSLLADSIRIQKNNLIVPYVIFRLNREIHKEFIIPLIKVEADQIETLKKKVHILEEKVAKLPSYEAKINHCQQIIQNLEKRTHIFHYNPGVFIPLIVNEENNPNYKIRMNYLIRKRPQTVQGSKQNKLRRGAKKPYQILSLSLILSQPIDEAEKLFSYQIIISDIPNSKSKIFIGICTKVPPGKQPFEDENVDYFDFIIPRLSQQQMRKANESAIPATQKISLCEVYYYNNDIKRLKNQNNHSFGTTQQQHCGIGVQKGDIVVLTVDLQNNHLTWYKNEISIERSYFEKPQTNIYPFIYLQPDVEVAL